MDNNKIVENLISIINNVIDTTGMTEDEKSNVMNELVYHLTEDNIEKVDVVTEEENIDEVSRRILRESLEEVNPKLYEIWNVTHDLWDEHTKVVLYNLMYEGYTSIRIMMERILECVIDYGYTPAKHPMITKTIYEDDNPIIVTDVSYTLQDPNNKHYPFFMTVCFKYYTLEAYWSCTIGFHDRTGGHLLGKCSYNANRYVFAETLYCYEYHEYRDGWKSTPMVKPEMYMYKYNPNKCDEIYIKEDTVLSDKDFVSLKRYNNTVTVADFQYLYQMLKYGFGEIQLYKDNAEEE